MQDDTELVKRLARAIAKERNVDPDEQIDVFGNKAWSWYVEEVNAILPIIKEREAAARAAWAGTAEIEQVDRDAVNAFHSASFTALFNGGGDKKTVGGNINAAHTLLLEAFARHRISARAAGAADMQSDEGPQPLPVKYTCEGCHHFSKAYWNDYLDNDETDSGYHAACAKAGKHIASYWSTNQAPPSWCPIAALEPKP